MIEKPFQDEKAALMNRTVTFPREELFDRVWSTPLLKLAKEIGISDVALAKACRRAGIPLPGRGHWAKGEKHRPRRPSLPKVASGTAPNVTFTVLDQSAFRLTRKAEVGIDKIDVPPSLSDPDILIVATLRAAKKTKPYNGWISLKSERVLAVRLSEDAFDRAMILLDTLIKECRRRGYPWKISQEGKTIIHCDGCEIEVKLSERLSKRELPRRMRDRYAWETGPARVQAATEYEWISTGFLTFEVENPVAGRARRAWADGNIVKLESKLHEIVAGLPVVAQGIRALDAEQEERKRKAAEAEAARRSAARAREVARKMRATLTMAVTKWERAKRIRAFCVRLESRAKMTSEEALQGCAPWLVWARQQADILDPTFGDVTDLVGMSVDLPEWFGGESYGRPEPDWWSK